MVHEQPSDLPWISQVIKALGVWADKRCLNDLTKRKQVDPKILEQLIEMREKLAWIKVPTEISLQQLFSVAISDTLTWVFKISPNTLNPKWENIENNSVIGSWIQFSATQKENQWVKWWCMKTTCFVSSNANDIIPQTEPYEITNTDWQEWNMQNVYYIRNKHTGEILSKISQLNNWSWKIEYKYITKENKENWRYCHSLKWAIFDFINTIQQDTSYSQINWEELAIKVHEELCKMDNKNVRKNTQKFEQWSARTWKETDDDLTTTITDPNKYNKGNWEILNKLKTKNPERYKEIVDTLVWRIEEWNEKLAEHATRTLSWIEDEDLISRLIIIYNNYKNERWNEIVELLIIYIFSESESTQVREIIFDNFSDNSPSQTRAILNKIIKYSITWITPSEESKLLDRMTSWDLWGENSREYDYIGKFGTILTNLNSLESLKVLMLFNKYERVMNRVKKVISNRENITKRALSSLDRKELLCIYNSLVFKTTNLNGVSTISNEKLIEEIMEIGLDHAKNDNIVVDIKRKIFRSYPELIDADSEVITHWPQN